MLLPRGVGVFVRFPTAAEFVDDFSVFKMTIVREVARISPVIVLNDLENNAPPLPSGNGHGVSRRCG